jgi:hypothetical protein
MINERELLSIKFEYRTRHGSQFVRYRTGIYTLNYFDSKSNVFTLFVNESEELKVVKFKLNTLQQVINLIEILNNE